MTRRAVSAATGALTLIMIGALLAPPARAQELGERAKNTCLFPIRKLATGRGNACIAHSSCEYGQLCVEGFCQDDLDAQKTLEDQRDDFAKREPPPPLGPEAVMSTREECDADRRCRIERLERRNQARRYSEMLKEEEQALMMQEALEEKKLDAQPRLRKPFAAEFYASYGPGLNVSYTLAGRLRLEGQFTASSNYIYDSTTVDGVTTYLEGSLNIRTLGVGVTYLLKTGWWTPYVTAAGWLGRGSANQYSYNDDGDFGFGSGSSSDTTAVMHVVEGRVGFDAQLLLGARARLGLVLRQPIYTQVKYGPGNYDTSGRDLIHSWMKENRRIWPEFSIGWAF